jgi:prepilin-type processing-associated H-X9-DG protein
MRTQCLSGVKQIGLAFNLFKDENADMYPPAGYGVNGNNQFQLAWDDWLNRHIGARTGDDELIEGATGVEHTPKVLKCPADREQKVVWIGDWFGVRSYAMVSVGTSWSTEYQVDTQGQTYPLPTPRMGVGIYWQDEGLGGLPDWNAKGYRSSVVRDPSGTLMLVEQANGQGAAGNIWPCISIGPYGSGALYQIQPNAPVQDANSGTGVNQGEKLYKAHRNRFNYLFYDGHVEALRVEATLGTGTKFTPKGMWTMDPKD